MNDQPIEKIVNYTYSGSLSVVALFRTIQAEGLFAGMPGIFLRLAGCNLQCDFCDTDYTSDRRLMSVSLIVDEIEALTHDNNRIRISGLGSRALVVITGGEPFRQNITPVVDALHRRGYVVQIETNGTLPPSAGLSRDVFVICSPKRTKINRRLIPYISAYKYVIQSGSVSKRDGLPIFAIDTPVKYSIGRPDISKDPIIFIQPLDEGDEVKNKANLDAVVESCLEYGHIAQLQINKIMGIE